MPLGQQIGPGDDYPRESEINRLLERPVEAFTVHLLNNNAAPFKVVLYDKTSEGRTE